MAKKKEKVVIADELNHVKYHVEKIDQLGDIKESDESQVIVLDYHVKRVASIVRRMEKYTKEVVGL